MIYRLISLSLWAALVIIPVKTHRNQPQYPPGVPPPAHQHKQQQQQYQQPPPPQQQQQQQQQQQYQQQNVNQMNQQQVPVPQEGVQPPVQEGHGHHEDSLRFSSDVHNAEHVMEHLENVIEKPKEQMTEEELEFHYFKMHDYDDNNKLDGVEIGKALTHYHADTKDTSTPQPDVKIFTDDEIANIVDVVLRENDLDGDGYIEYAEFKRAQDKEKQKPPPPETPPKL